METRTLVMSDPLLVTAQGTSAKLQCAGLKATWACVQAHREFVGYLCK